MPGARCTRGLACKMMQTLRTRAYRFSGNTPASPTQWLYGLCRARPGDEFVFVTVADELMADQTRSGRLRLRQLDISNGCQAHTVLPYAASRLRPRASPGQARLRPEDSNQP
jgi:hypothetical protein